MASLSLPPAASLDSLPSSGPPRHARKHSRYPTGAAPLPSFTFSPGTTPQEANSIEDGREDEELSMVGSGHMRRPSKPTPLPAFTFNPGADMPVQRTPSPTHPILEEMALNQQRISKSARPAPLPAFTFNPSSANGSTSPTKLEYEPDPFKVTGHRRGNSEFVGGKAEGAQLVNVNTSPAKHEPRPSGPPVSGPAYRSHTHRRSQAISVSDIDTSDLIKQHALAKARAPSNPATPQEGTFSFPRPSPNQRNNSSSSRSPPTSPRRRGSASGYRPRTVDFSERVDVIPRPLSMISSETEMSSSTIRGHSVSNSINSIASPSQLSLPDFTAHISSPEPESIFNRRPNTADPSLLLSSNNTVDERNLLTMPKRPLSASESPLVSSSGSPPLKKKHFWSTHGDDPSPTPTPRTEAADPFETPPDTIVPNTSYARPKTAPARPSGHRGRKYHTWTAGIFSKKSKYRGSKKSRRSPTPPSLLRRDSDKVNDIFDDDNTVVLCEGSPVSTGKQTSAEQRFSIPPPSLTSTDVASPMIDLDAALETQADDTRLFEDHTKTTTARIAKLHSSERRGVVDAFGVSHRRTESAPAMSPVNRSALFGLRQHGSNASLSEDVFDEEEEDNFWAREQDSKPNAQHSPMTKQTATPSSVQDTGLGLSNLSNCSDDVVIVDPDNENVAEDVRSSKSTLEAPALIVEDLPKRPSTSPMAFAYPDPHLHYASSTEGRTTSASLISSPDADHVSFDIQSRQRRLGELNTDLLRPSTDDLPSLSDSVSSNAFPRGSSSGNTRPSLEQRSNSMFVPGSRRLHEGWKRSSLASLNRLIPGSAHGSKLKLETIPPEGEEKTKKKSNRISKLMRFWRSKETEGRPATSS